MQKIFNWFPSKNNILIILHFKTIGIVWDRIYYLNSKYVFKKKRQQKKLKSTRNFQNKL